MGHLEHPILPECVKDRVEKFPSNSDNSLAGAAPRFDTFLEVTHVGAVFYGDERKMPPSYTRSSCADPIKPACEPHDGGSVTGAESDLRDLFPLSSLLRAASAVPQDTFRPATYPPRRTLSPSRQAPTPNTYRLALDMSRRS